MERETTDGVDSYVILYRTNQTALHPIEKYPGSMKVKCCNIPDSLTLVGAMLASAVGPKSFCPPAQCWQNVGCWNSLPNVGPALAGNVRPMLGQPHYQPTLVQHGTNLGWESWPNKDPTLPANVGPHWASWQSDLGPTLTADVNVGPLASCYLGCMTTSLQGLANISKCHDLPLDCKKHVDKAPLVFMVISTIIAHSWW